MYTTNALYMEILKIKASVRVHENTDSIEPEDRALLEMAKEQIPHAYAPYSLFRVGAAVRLQNGTVYPGCNQENASYPLCMCGERVALYTAAAQAPDQAPVALAIVVKNDKKPVETPVSPCGACRQVIAEFEHRFGQPIRIFLQSGHSKIYELHSVKDILPLTFDASFL